MPFIGRQPVIGNFQKCDSISVVNGQAAYTLQVGGVNVSPQSENHMLVSLNGILQAPVDSFTVSGSTLTFASNLVTGDVIDFVMILGNVLDLGVPSDNTVSLAKLTATGTKDSTTFLRGDNTFSALPASGITQADQWRLNASLSTNASILTSNLERNDTSFAYIGSGMTESSGVFTFPATGIYRVDFNVVWSAVSAGDIRYAGGEIQYSNNNFSSSGILAEAYNGCNNHGLTYYMSSHMTSFFDVNDTTNDKVRFRVTASASISCVGSTSANYTAMTFTRLGDT